MNPATHTADVDILHIVQLERYDIDILDRPGMPSFMELVRSALTGQLDLSMNSILQFFANLVFSEFMLNGQLIRQLLIVAILGALMSAITQAFTHKSASETGFYVTYLMAALLAISSFRISVEILTGLTATVNSIMQAAFPMMIGLVAMGGNFIGAASFHPLLFFSLQLVAGFITHIFIPMVLAAAALDIASQLSDESKSLDKLAELTRKIADWTLKGIVAAFALVLTLQRIAAPITSNIALRTSRNVVGAIPIVGNAFTAAMDTVVGFSQAARSGVLVALVIVLCITLVTPLIKMLVLAFVYRIVAAFLQPIADKRLVSLMEGVSKHVGLMFSAAGLLGVMCVYTVIILLWF